ncbi:MAG: lamin tail domain-containing protein, partial [Planctomycetota bacterium]|nr:lamin tail domain-containing protein [Planctomycetota bacterium]
MKNLRSTVLWLLFGLASPPLGAQDILVTEVLTLNDSQLADEDGFFSDWLELFNASAVDVPLGGWYLTDDPGELTRWRFPDVTLPAGDYLVVFASSKDRRDPASELHTNFRLTSRGEYLALVEPDGLTVAFDYAPTLPPQFADVSYGLAQGGTGSTLVAEGATASTFVPSNDTLGRSWTLPDFADAGWARGPTGIGYDTGGDYTALIGSDVQARMLGVNPTVYLRLPFDVTDPAAIDRLTLRIRYDDGFVAYLNGQEVSRRNAPAVPTWNSSATAEHGQPETARMAQSFDGGGTGYMLTAHAANVRPRVLTGGPTGRFLELLRDGQGGLANTVGFARVFGPAALVAAEFDFRMPTEAGHAGCCGERADGFGFALVDTAVYGNSGPGPFVGNIVWERPRFPNAFCVGFDIFDGSGNENTVSLNWNGVEVAARRVDQFPLNNGVFNRCRIEIRQDGNASLVRVTIIPDVHGRAGAPAVIFEDHRIPGMTPFDSRVAFGGRTGGAFVALALDNVDVSYSSAV